MNLLPWDPCAELKEMSRRVKSCIQEISIPLLNKSQGVDYTGLNAALRRYEQDSRQTGIDVTQSSQNKHASDISNS